MVIPALVDLENFNYMSEKNIQKEQSARANESEFSEYFTREELQRGFLKPYKIREEDYALVNKIIRIIEGWNYFGASGEVSPRDVLVVSFHNFFSSAVGKTPEKLDEMKKEKYRPKNWTEFLDLLKELTDKYTHRAPDQLLKILHEDLGIGKYRSGIDKLPS